MVTLALSLAVKDAHGQTPATDAVMVLVSPVKATHSGVACSRHLMHVHLFAINLMGTA